MTHLASDWRGRAECLDATELHTGKLGVEDVALALSICATCPVLRECDDLARALRPEWGVWAGRLYRPRPSDS